MAENTVARSEGLEARYERYKSILKDLTIMSDIFMRNVFKKRECTEYVLRVIMGQKDLRVIDQVLQKDYKNLQGRSAILDCVVRDSEGRQMDVEIQQDNEGASPKRARYHSGLMDMNTLNPGQDFDELPESYVVFITRDDLLGGGYPIYHIDRKIAEMDTIFRDDAHIIYVNAKKQEDTELGRLAHDLHCKKADDMYSEILADRVKELKETQEGVEFMCHEMEQIYSEGIESGLERGFERGMEQGEQKKARELALKLYQKGDTIEVIAELVEVPVAQLEEWLGLQAV
ncbi:MAG: Rpn family recombination-promoting nuclease/putative transposase [Lachnospiraceae bacterium]|nr:Rpn family recombination-promoting nuclease/putative transposase [Lachnospiraceae bacterium]